MSSQVRPGELTASPLAFTGTGTALASYRPRPGSLVTTILALSTRAGSLQLYLRLAREGIETAIGAAISVSANAFASGQINFPLGELEGFDVLAIFTDTSGLSGSVRFFASDDAHSR